MNSKEVTMRIIALILTFLATPLNAHELWLEPLNYQISAESNLEAAIVNGQEFAGTRLPYLPQRYKHFTVFGSGQNALVGGRPGDTPALNMSVLGDGLHVVVYQSTPSVIAYEEWEKFQKFVNHKDLGDARAISEANGWPLEGFSEVYTRFSKTLIAVGSADGADLRAGLLTELVALNNPYVDDLSEGLRVQLFYGQGVRANEQVELFAKAPDSTVTITLHRTNDEGIATLPVQAGYAYMVDAVVLREASAELAAERDAIWETLWANLTFAVPE
jgi:hypothetical protein